MSMLTGSRADNVEPLKERRLNGQKNKRLSLRSLIGEEVLVEGEKFDYGVLVFNRNPSNGNEGFYVNGRQIVIDDVARVHKRTYTIKLYSKESK